MGAAKIGTYITIFLFLPIFAHANSYTLPIDTGDVDVSITSYFDHDDSVSSKLRYDGETVFNYDNHHGIDYGTTVEEKEIYAAADGIIRADGWENPLVFTQGYGYRIYIYHPEIDQRTIYGHATTTADYVNVSDTVTRGDTIILSGNTGDTTGPHLHFGVYVGDSSDPTDQIDPYGWWLSTPDPRTNDLGYLWTTDSPSFDLARTVSGSITVPENWRGNYVVNGSLGVDSGVSLTLESGTVLKFQDSSSHLAVYGSLLANGTDLRPVYFTSIYDDAIAGDTNQDGSSTSPVPGNWFSIITNENGSTNLNHSIVRYGAASSCCSSWQSGAIINAGGIVNLTDSTISFSTYGIDTAAGTTTVTSSLLEDNVYSNATHSGGNLIISSSTLVSNNRASMWASMGNISISNTEFILSGGYASAGSFHPGVHLVHSNNTATGTGQLGFLMSGTDHDETWSPDGIPYLIYDSFTVYQGTTLTIEPGSVIKFVPDATFGVAGSLNVQGATSSKVYFTSIHDDSVGGDTLGDGNAVSPSPADWQVMDFSYYSTSSIDNAVIRYGGRASWAYQANILNNSDQLTISNSEIAFGNGYGIVDNYGTVDIFGSNIHDNGGMGMLNTSIATSTATNNYWGDPSGPYHPSLNPGGVGDGVSDYIDFSSWLLSAP